MTPEDYTCRKCGQSMSVPDGMDPLEEGVRFCESCAYDEIERLTAIVGIIRPEAGQGAVFDDYCATVQIVREFWKHGSLQARVQAMADDRKRLTAIVEQLRKDIDFAVYKLLCVELERSIREIPEILKVCDRQALNILREAAEKARNVMPSAEECELDGMRGLARLAGGE